jgi:SAM-dependent methyltransferase
VPHGKEEITDLNLKTTCDFMGMNMANPNWGSPAVQLDRNESKPAQNPAGLPAPWYLDRLVADQKRTLNQRLIRRWTDTFDPATVLKTDLFEESHGTDQILFDLFPTGPCVLGVDISEAVAFNIQFCIADVRRLGLATGSIHLIISTSTLDHFEHESDFCAALEELTRVLAPGGFMIIFLDNPQNPLYWPLRWLSRYRISPFLLGYTTSARGLIRYMDNLGLEILGSDALIHNPRLISTLLFQVFRHLLGRYADLPIKGLLRVFAVLQHLPTKWFTGCFVAACARKPVVEGRNQSKD